MLCTSYALADELGARVSRAIVHMRGMRLGAYLDAFRAVPDAVLLTPAAWAGVSLPGMVDHVVMISPDSMTTAHSASNDELSSMDDDALTAAVSTLAAHITEARGAAKSSTAPPSRRRPPGGSAVTPASSPSSMGRTASR